MTKIVLCEPYAASRAGHHLRNGVLLPKEMDEIGKDYTFIADKGFKQKNENVKELFTSELEYLSKTDDSFINIRKNDYLRVLNLYKSATFVFLTTFDNDLDVWIQLLSDEQIIKKIKNEDKLIIIHNWSLLYPQLCTKKKKLKRIFKELKNHIFLSFFSEFQTLIAREIIPEGAFMTLFLPSFRSSKSKNEQKGKGGFLSYLGSYRSEKRPDMVLNAAQYLNNESFMFQIDNINEFTYMSFKQLLSMDNVNLISQKMTEKQYSQSLANTKIGLMPYNCFLYAGRNSGVLEEFIFSAIPVIVPQNTWLSYFLKKNKGGGITFNEKIEDDFLIKLQMLIADYSNQKQKALKIADKVYSKRNTESFIKIIEKLESTRDSNETISQEDINENKTAISNEKSLFFTRVAEELLNNDGSKKAKVYLQKAFNENSKYWKTHLLYNKIEEKKTIFALTKTLYEKKILYNPFDIIEILQNMRTLIIEKTEMNFFLYLFNEYKIYNFVPVSLLSKFNRDIKFEYDLIDKKTKKELRKIICQNESKKDFISLFIYLGDSAKTNKIKNWDWFYKKALYLLKESDKKEKINAMDIYHLASIYKTLKKYDMSTGLFESIIENDRSDEFKSGVFFHLGDICRAKGQNYEAELLFKQCLSINPYNSKAKKYLKDLKSE